MAERVSRAISEFEAFASAVDVDGQKAMTVSDLMDCFGVHQGRAAMQSQGGIDDEKRLILLPEFIVMCSVNSNSSSFLSEQFKMMDTNKDGKLSLSEFNAVIGHSKLLDSTEDHFLQRYFGTDGAKTLSYKHFCLLMQEMKEVVRTVKWQSLKPAPDGTVRLSSVGLLLIKTMADDLPPVLAHNLSNPTNSEVKIKYDDFVDFESVMDRLEDLEELMEAELDKTGKLTRAQFNSIVSSLVSPRRRSVFFGTASKSSLVLDSLFSWLDEDKTGVLNKKEVRALLDVASKGSKNLPPPRPLSLIENIVLGASSSAIAGTIVFPMDTVKARMMSGGGGNILSMFSSIIKAQGFSGLYRGLPAQVLGVMPEKALKLTLYNTLRSKLADPETGHATYANEALAGSVTAMVQVFVTNPYELIKIRQQTSQGEPITTTIKQLGLKGLSQGLSACLLRDIPFNAMYFSSYAFLKDSLKSEEGLLSPVGLMTAGLGAGLIAGGLTTPFDVIKTKMQSSRSKESLFTCVRGMYAQGGAKAFLRGLGPRLMLIPPMFACTMTLFETFQGMWFPQTVRSKPHEGGSNHSATMAEIVKHRVQHLEKSLSLAEAS